MKRYRPIRVIVNGLFYQKGMEEYKDGEWVKYEEAKKEIETQFDIINMLIKELIDKRKKLALEEVKKIFRLSIGMEEGDGRMVNTETD